MVVPSIKADTGSVFPLSVVWFAATVFNHLPAANGTHERPGSRHCPSRGCRLTGHSSSSRTHLEWAARRRFQNKQTFNPTFSCSEIRAGKSGFLVYMLSTDFPFLSALKGFCGTPGVVLVGYVSGLRFFSIYCSRKKCIKSLLLDFFVTVCNI